MLAASASTDSSLRMMFGWPSLGGFSAEAMSVFCYARSWLVGEAKLLTSFCSSNDENSCGRAELTRWLKCAEPPNYPVL